MFERFVKDARQVVVEAQQEAGALDAPAVGVEHLLLATMRRCPFVFVDEAPTPYVSLYRHGSPHADRLRDLLRRQTAEALQALGVSLVDIEARAAATFGDDEWQAVTHSERLPFRSDAKHALEEALRVALDTRTRRITPAHILVAVLRSGDRARELVSALGFDPGELEARAESMLVRVRDLVGR